MKQPTFRTLRLPTATHTPLSCSVRTIEIHGVPNPFNASIMDTRFGYLLAYRVSNSPPSGYGEEFIACCYLDHGFRPASDSWRLSLGSNADEDPRLVRVKDRVSLLYGGPANDPMAAKERAVYLADLDLTSERISVREGSTVKLAHGTKQTLCEKNWTPFVYKGRLLLTYTICPHEVVKITSGGVCQEVYTTDVRTPWHEYLLRGGTPAVRLATGEYLAFFHTHVCPFAHLQGPGDVIPWEVYGLRHYFMGCYTFQDSPPFRLLRCSAAPIVYPGIHNTPNPRIPKHSVVFPAGLIVENGKVHVSCGENDACIRIVSFQLHELLASLVPLPVSEIRG